MPADTRELEVQTFLFTPFGYIFALVSMRIWWIREKPKGNVRHSVSTETMVR